MEHCLHRARSIIASQNDNYYNPSTSSEKTQQPRSHKKGATQSRPKSIGIHELNYIKPVQKRRSSGILRSPGKERKSSPLTTSSKTPKISLNSPVIPDDLLDNIVNQCLASSKLSEPETREIIVTICRYWSLKREARSGAALLKRLHLEVFFQSNFSLGVNKFQIRN